MINEDRREGFVFKPVRVVAASEQHVDSPKYPASTVYYLTIDVVETECSVLSGKSWQECKEPFSFHQMVFGQCKAIILISLPWRVNMLLNYNCTAGSVPSRVIHRTCPDCPTLGEITPSIIAKADKLISEYNTDSNNTRYFKTSHIERMTSQHVGFCTGSIMTSNIDGKEYKQISCDIYDQKITKYQDELEACGYPIGIEVNIPTEDQEKPDLAIATQEKPLRCGHRHKHIHSHKGHNHKHGSSSEEHTDKKPFVRETRGSVQTFILMNESDILPAPFFTQAIPPLPSRAGAIKNFIEFPEVESNLETCPWVKEDLPQISRFFQNIK
ncbi:hypothetical protein GDO86_011055 [Hymenochirus boettgeri]|uniref:Uncharacterized protein n=1 Tax=Hymenochirus boettgeri TaxID=247094 RepID=A0A8T2JCP4_9PIPI|nr:hypothetical protein GDO86_011055 [Hymenochirus boettgeri]